MLPHQTTHKYVKISTEVQTTRLTRQLFSGFKVSEWAVKHFGMGKSNLNELNVRKLRNSIKSKFVILYNLNDNVHIKSAHKNI